MKRLFFWGRLLIGLLLIGYLLYTTDFGELRALVSRASVALLGVAYLVGIVDRVLMAYKWNLLLRAQAIVISLVDATITYLMSTFLGLFLPATVGGDAIRAFAVSKFGYSAADAASTIIIERALGMLALMFMVVTSILVGGMIIGSAYIADLSNVLTVVGVAALLGLLLLALSLSRFVGTRLAAWRQHYGDAKATPQKNTSQKAVGTTAASPRRLPRAAKIGRFLAQIGESYSTFQGKKGLLVLFFGLSVVENLFPIAWSYTLALAFQLQVSLLDCFVVVPSVLILRRLPISIDGIGIHQAAFVTLLSLTGVPESHGLLLGVATHLLATALVLPGGAFYMVRGMDMSKI